MLALVGGHAALARTLRGRERPSSGRRTASISSRSWSRSGSRTRGARVYSSCKHGSADSSNEECPKNTQQEQEDEQEDEKKDSVVESKGVQAALFALQWYKDWISPILPSSCRFLPSCSSYSKEAYTKFGVFQGTVLTAWRLLRCNPFVGEGWEYDPPEKWQKVIFQRTSKRED